VASDVIYRAAHVPLLLHTLQALVCGLERQRGHRRTKKVATTALVAFDKRGREGVETFLKAAAAAGSGLTVRHVSAAEMPPGARFTHFGCVVLTASRDGASAAGSSSGAPAVDAPEQARRTPASAGGTLSEPPRRPGLELAPHADGKQCGAPALSLAAVAAAKGGLKPTGLDRCQTAGARLDPGGSGQFLYRNFDGLAAPGETSEGEVLVALFEAHISARNHSNLAGVDKEAPPTARLAPAVAALPFLPAPPPLLANAAPATAAATVATAAPPAADWAALAAACPAAHFVDATKLQQRAPKSAKTFAMDCLNGEYT
jgi:hypothetical protein